MIKVLVFDDEKLAREELQKTVSLLPTSVKK